MALHRSNDRAAVEDESSTAIAQRARPPAGRMQAVRDRSGVVLDVAALDPRVVLEPAAGGEEGIGDRDAHILVRGIDAAIAGNHDEVVGDAELDPDMELLPLVVAPMWDLDHDRAVLDPVVGAFEPVGPALHERLRRRARRNVSEGDLERCLHDEG